MTARRQKFPWRSLVQGGFFVLILAISINHTLVESGGGLGWLSAASLHGICPFGGVVSIWNLITGGTLVQKVHEASLVLMVIVGLLTLLAGPVFCGWVCPMGSVQEWVSRLGRRLLGRRHNHLVPYRLDRALRYLRYLVLVWVVYMTAATGTLIFADWDPYAAMFSIWSDEVAIGGLVVLGAVLLLSLAVERPFCKYACPYGALLGLGNLVRVFAIRRNASTCINCKRCDTSCPMNIPVSASGVVRDHQCISCLKCTSEQACPVAETVQLQTVQLQPAGREAV